MAVADQKSVIIGLGTSQPIPVMRMVISEGVGPRLVFFFAPATSNQTHIPFLKTQEEA